MNEAFAGRRTASTTSIELIAGKTFPAWRDKQSKAVQAWLVRSGFEPRPGAVAVLPAQGKAQPRVLACIGEQVDLWSVAGLPGQLAAGTYEIVTKPTADEATQLAIGWGLGSYRYRAYLSGADRRWPKLVMPQSADGDEVRRQVAAATLVRDLINTPAADLGPPELAAAAAALARKFGAKVTVVSGKILERNFPAVHAVGQAAEKKPRLIDFRWGRTSDPKVTLVGKGVCFDTGGLDIKPAQGMRLMKKDMGGAAAVLGLAHLIMDGGLPVRLRVVIPAVENNIAGNAYRPGDIIRTRHGTTVEIGNTDAEGRVILADALALADEESPDFLLDCATLTGAARVALGPDLPALFCGDDDTAMGLLGAGDRTLDPLWRLPLWQPYRRYIDSPIADINNAGTSGFAGAITAALFLSTFVANAKVWAHIDLFGWNEDSRPGRPKGGEAMAIRAVLEFLRHRFGA